MPLDAKFIEIAQKYFDPYLPNSGTEHVAFLLYSLTRMLRPRTVVEYGSGYSTLFILRALADNISDFQEEHASLLAKSKVFDHLDHSADHGSSDQMKSALHNWFGAGGKACGVDPSYYEKYYQPHLFSFEISSIKTKYAQSMKSAVKDAHLADLFTQYYGQTFRKEVLPSYAKPIDLCWNDDTRYIEFFTEFWEELNPSGGIFIFHNVPAYEDWHKAILWMKERRLRENDLEVLLLEEPHKLNQNGCAILRRTSTYVPRYATTRPGDLLRNIRKFLMSTEKT